MAKLVMLRLGCGILWALATTTAAAPLPCHILTAQAAESTAKTAYELFDPSSVLLAKGIDPKRVTGRVDSDGPNDGAITLQLMIDGANIGYLVMVQEFDVNSRLYPTIAKIEVKPDYQGKGLGSILYIAANRMAVERFNRPLHRSELTSQDAKRTWRRFVELEYAELTYDEYGGETIAFRPGVAATLGSKAAQEIFEPK